ncbi:MAG: hypothetical protein R3Y64_11035 [Peptostreptococcaceae bacterium]
MSKLTNRKMIEQQIMFYRNNMSILGETDLENLKELEEQLEKSKRGKGAKLKGASYERTVAKIFKKYLGIDLARTPQSGGFAKKSEKAEEFRGDIVNLDNTKEFKLHIECKNQKTLKIKDWFKQALEDCPLSKIPCIVFHQQLLNKEGKRVQESEDFITMRLEDFLELVDKDIIVKEVE